MKTNFKIPALAFVLLLVMSLACGGSDAPEIVATSESTRSESEAQSGDVEDGDGVESETEQASEEETVVPAEEDTGEITESEENESSVEPEEADSSASTEEFSIGDTVSIGNTVLVVLGWEELPGDDFIQPEEGNKFVAVEMIIVNQGDSTTAVSSILQMSLRDETSQIYDVDFAATTALDSGSIDKELAPGEQVRGKVGFQVPEDTQNLVFVFDEDAFGSGKVFVDLGNEPLSVDPPAEIAGSTEQEAYNIGDIVEIGQNVITVLGWEEVDGDEFNQPEGGNKFVAVEVLVVNKGEDTSAALSSLLQMSLRDGMSRVYDVDFQATSAIGSGSIDGELVPGERVRGKVGFQVPEDVQQLVFVFDADVFGLGKVNFALNSEPTSVEPPADIAGEQEIETYAIGETIEFDTVALTVNEVTYSTTGDLGGPEQGNQFAVVDLTLENLSSEAINLSSLLQMTIKDQDGRVFGIDPFAPAEAAPEGELASGETIRGQVGFQVPIDAERLIFVFDADVFDTGKIFVDLSQS